MGMRYQDGIMGVTKQDVCEHNAQLRRMGQWFMGTTIFRLVLGFVAVLFLAGA
jgi:hypothetical protein